jgi:hypothetical protein
LCGHLYDEDDSGYLGKQLIKFGDAAIGNSYLYRVKDFVAYYLSKITNPPKNQDI